MQPEQHPPPGPLPSLRCARVQASLPAPLPPGSNAHALPRVPHLLWPHSRQRPQQLPALEEIGQSLSCG